MNIVERFGKFLSCHNIDEPHIFHSVVFQAGSFLFHGSILLGYEYYDPTDFRLCFGLKKIHRFSLEH